MVIIKEIYKFPNNLLTMGNYLNNLYSSDIRSIKFEINLKEKNFRSAKGGHKAVVKLLILILGIVATSISSLIGVFSGSLIASLIQRAYSDIGNFNNFSFVVISLAIYTYCLILPTNMDFKSVLMN